MQMKTVGNMSQSVVLCDQPSQYVLISLDCDDELMDVSPEGIEVCDSIDNNCDGNIDESTTTDAQNSIWMQMKTDTEMKI